MMLILEARSDARLLGSPQMVVSGAVVGLKASLEPAQDNPASAVHIYLTSLSSGNCHSPASRTTASTSESKSCEVEKWNSVPFEYIL